MVEPSVIKDLEQTICHIEQVLESLQEYRADNFSVTTQELEAVTKKGQDEYLILTKAKPYIEHLEQVLAVWTSQMKSEEELSFLGQLKDRLCNVIQRFSAERDLVSQVLKKINNGRKSVSAYKKFR